MALDDGLTTFLENHHSPVLGNPITFVTISSVTLILKPLTAKCCSIKARENSKVTNSLKPYIFSIYLSHPHFKKFIMLLYVVTGH